MAACTICRYEAGAGVLPGPSEHEPWCGAFMVGPVEVEGQTSLMLGARRGERASVTVGGATFTGAAEILYVTEED